MDAAHSLLRRFSSARLDLEILHTPIGGNRSARDIVQLDITSAARGAHQRFQIYQGASTNRVDVLGVEPRRQQLVLFIEEPRRAFEVNIGKHVVVPPGTRVIRETHKQKTIEQFTVATKRHYLCGMDEQHLFIAELPAGASTPHAARETLRAPEVPPSLVVRGEQVVRQGEWFFLPSRDRDQPVIEAALREKRVFRDVGIAQAAGLARAGRPHVASEVVVFPSLERSARARTTTMPQIFVRGDVRHPDHKTVSFRDFKWVVPNREKFARPAAVASWVD